MAEMLIPDVIQNNPVLFLNSMSAHLSELKRTDSEEIATLIKELKDNAATGHDSLPTKLFKICSGGLCKPIADLVNITLQTGVFPDCLKLVLMASGISKINHQFLMDYWSGCHCNFQPSSSSSSQRALFEQLMIDWRAFVWPGSAKLQWLL
ncbi:hypothetical protein B566_EDAN011255 [Ephemera danica]|nr:hypothetical protein B566_EDAN011255 [Ephemera danica]